MTTAPAGGSEGPLAIVCGGGTLPFAVADAVIKRGRTVIMIALRGAADATAVARYPHHWFNYGQFGRFIRIARTSGVTDVVMIGSLVRPSFWQVRPDLTALSVLPRILAIFRGGDNHLLSSVAKIMEDFGFRLLGAHEVAPEILMPEGVLGRVQPSHEDHDDIAVGIDFLHAMGPFDIGQAVAVARKHVLAVEAAEGTDLMLARVSELRNSGRIRTPRGAGVLVKAPKPGQDRRFDLPSIGPQTVERAAAAGLAGIAVAAGGAVVAEPERLVATADRENIFVLGMPAG